MLSLHIMALPHFPERLLRVRGALMFEAGDASVIPVIVFERVGFFAVDGVVADFAHFVRHAQGHAADVFDEDHDQGRPDDVPADGEEGADDLKADLAAVAGDGAAGVGETEGRAAFLRCPETWKMTVSERSDWRRWRSTYRYRRLRQWRQRNECERHPGYHQLGA